jgi:hypothetical protein
MICDSVYVGRLSSSLKLLSEIIATAIASRQDIELWK